MCASEYGKCDICGKEGPLSRTYFYYDINCQCCGCKVDGRNMHFELVCHCDDCIPDIPKKIRPIIKSKIDNRSYEISIDNMVPYEINGEFCIGSEKYKKTENDY